MPESCLLPTCGVGGALSAGGGAPACGARRRGRGPTRSYASATPAGLTQRGSHEMRTSRGVLPVRPRRATLASLSLWRGGCIGQHTLERCPQKPITLPRSQLGSWNARRALYQHVGNFVGSVTSPVVSNIYLHVLDRYWEQQYSSLGHLTRYADDMVGVCRPRREAEHALHAVPQVLQKRKLTTHPTKTRIVDMQQAGFEFLGCHFHKGRARRSGKLIPLMWPGQKAMQAIRSPIREQTARRGLKYTLKTIVAKLNPIIRGWRNYFRVGNATKKFQALDRYVNQRVVQWIRAHRKGATTPAQLQARLSTSGLEHFSARGMCGTRP